MRLIGSRRKTENRLGRSVPCASKRLRIVALETWTCFADVICVPGNWAGRIPGLKPNIIAGQPANLDRLAEMAARGICRIPSLDTAVVVLAKVNSDVLGRVDSDALWRAFRVPVYEVLADTEHGVLARECEAHEGWHISHPRLRFELQSGRVLFQRNGPHSTPIPTGLIADGLDTLCPCGDEAPVLYGARAAVGERIALRRAANA